MSESKLPVTEELDFAYLLELMPPLHNEPEYAWLPELFSIVGHERLIELCKYTGGETIKIPTLDSLCRSIDALHHFYNIYVKKSESLQDVPEELLPLVCKIHEVYNVRNSSTDNS